MSTALNGMLLVISRPQKTFGGRVLPGPAVRELNALKELIAGFRGTEGKGKRWEWRSFPR